MHTPPGAHRLSGDPVDLPRHTGEMMISIAASAERVGVMPPSAMRRDDRGMQK
jgi:hypothetical protein